MKITPFWASVALLAPQALAEPEPTATSTTSTTSTSAAPTCTASLIANLCDYPEPGSSFAVASSGRAHCWEYCNNHPPCDFVVFAEGNPYLGVGTCWLYPGETYDESQGTSSGECQRPYLFVYDKPECSASPTSTAGACEATASPSAIASVCGYPTPDEGCFYDCAASSGASHCLSMCAERDACNYVVFNPHNPSNSQYASGTCWMYPNGTYDADAASTCDGEPEQWVYDNVCPKPSPSSSSASASSTSASSSATESSSGTETASNTPGSTAVAAEEATTTDENSAPAGLSLTMPLAIGVAMVMWQAL
ncbi:hypothetical protein BJY00DRAFT_295606 [Aspergillus carlsbadensis]|nr:hypothetical protein BJY00DRAFT_295606 [Aspergillus carlsbadensis]